MSTILLFNKPFMVLSQFTDAENRDTLKDFINKPNIYPAGRLDRDSEGLLLLTDDGKIQHLISHPNHKLIKTYWVQVEGSITDTALEQLQNGIELKDGHTKPAKARRIEEPENLWSRTPPIRDRKNIPTSWLELSISEGRNRQVRRMTAAINFPTLRLIRASIGPWSLEQLQPGELIEVSQASIKEWRATLPQKSPQKMQRSNRSSIENDRENKKNVKPKNRTYNLKPTTKKVRKTKPKTKSTSR